MKKVVTSEDLERFNVIIPLNIARSLLVLATKKYSDICIYLKNKDKYNLGPYQIKEIKKAKDAYDFFALLISHSILSNLNNEEQDNLRQYELAETVKMQNEIDKALALVKFNVPGNNEVN